MGLEYWNGYTTLSATQTHWCKGDAKLRRGTPLPLHPIRSASQEPCGKQRLALEKAPQHEPRCRAAGPKGRSFLCPQLCRNLEWNSVPRSRLMFVDACISTKEENAQSFCFFIFDQCCCVSPLCVYHKRTLVCAGSGVKYAGGRASWVVWSGRLFDVASPLPSPLSTCAQFTSHANANQDFTCMPCLVSRTGLHIIMLGAHAVFPDAW
jgi:hypothetical protein